MKHKPFPDGIAAPHSTSLHSQEKMIYLIDSGSLITKHAIYYCIIVIIIYLLLFSFIAWQTYFNPASHQRENLYEDCWILISFQHVSWTLLHILYYKCICVSHPSLLLFSCLRNWKGNRPMEKSKSFLNCWPNHTSRWVWLPIFFTVFLHFIFAICQGTTTTVSFLWRIIVLT